MRWVEIAYNFQEYLAVAIFVGMSTYSTGRFLVHIIKKEIFV